MSRAYLFILGYLIGAIIGIIITIAVMASEGKLCGF